MNDPKNNNSASTLVLNLPARMDLESVIVDLLIWAQKSGLLMPEGEERLARAWIEEIFMICSRTNDAPALNRVLALALKAFVVDARLLQALEQSITRFPRETVRVRG